MHTEDIVRLRESEKVVKQNQIQEEQKRLVIEVERLLRIRTKTASIDTISMLNRIVKQLSL